jgi:hypothetical protein
LVHLFIGRASLTAFFIQCQPYYWAIS